MDVEDGVKRNSQLDVNQRWTELSNAIRKSAKEKIGYEKRGRTRKPWITEEMRTKMNERWDSKRQNNEEGNKRYRQLTNELRRETDKAKEEWWDRECAELEELEAKGRTDLLYAKV